MNSVATRKLGSAKPRFANRHGRVVESRVLLQRCQDAEWYAHDNGEQQRKHAQPDRDRKVLLDDVVDRLVSQHERRTKVKCRDALDVVQVLVVPRLIEMKLPVEVALNRNGNRTL